MAVSLTPGTRLGPYEVTAQIGVGGMGEVYRARDTKLNREVALKVLPASFANDAHRLVRFTREAQTLASLNHPNIAHIYGLEESNSVGALVMELVEGDDLSQRIARGAIPINDALPIARQIADALEAAHEQGVVHRDLKPANVKVRFDGTVKVLDFGLAKALGAAGNQVMNLPGTMSPTLSLGATQAGVILGTAAYMAPEQAQGKSADRRSDIWAFGVVFYEMLTGKRMFGGESVAETLASVMKDQLTLERLPEETPEAIRTLVARCLEREPRRRLQSLGEARIVIEDAIAGVGDGQSEFHATPALQRVSIWPWVVAAFSILVSVGAITWVWSRPVPTAPAVARFTIEPPDGTVLPTVAPAAPNMAVSPDGRYVAFVVDEQTNQQAVWVRAIDSLSTRRLDRTEGAEFPFWSPDSQHVAYFSDGKLMRIAVAGGAPQTICEAKFGEGGTWFQGEGQDETIVFAARNSQPLMRVPATGGVPSAVSTLGAGESAHVFPHSLPDGQRFLYLVRGDKPGIYVQTLGSSERTFVVDAGRAVYSSPGFLLYLRDNTLLAHRWDLKSLRLEGEPIVIASGVRTGGKYGRNAFAVSDNGVLTYRAGDFGPYNITWYARDGKVIAPVMKSEEYPGDLVLSPDDALLVVGRVIGSEQDLWLKDLGSGVFSRLTRTSGAEQSPVWSPDSQRLAFVLNEGSRTVSYVTTIGSAEPTMIGSHPSGSRMQDWTPDGLQLLAIQSGTVVLLTVPQDHAPAGVTASQTVFKASYEVSQSKVAPGGGWVAYTSLESGRPEVWVASLPTFTNRRQVSTNGGVQPVWRADGEELFFLGLDQKLSAVEVKAESTFQFGSARTLFQTEAGANPVFYSYDVARDGKRFLVSESVDRAALIMEPLHVVTNWRSLVPQ